MSEQGQDTHPAGEALVAFALGHLDDSEAILIAQHLGVCETCQQAVLDVPDDSTLSLLRPASSTPLPRPELLGATALSFDDPLPPELRDHPRYRVLRRLGAGGMGVVYQAEHRLMERSVALKVISKQLTASPGAVERFRREVRAVARLSHPNLVQAHDAEQEGDLHFLVMEFVEGENLACLVERNGALPIARACDCVRQAAQGLAHALTLGLVHRDVKPQNLIVTPGGQVKLLDFGLARIAEERGGGLTELGQGMGTPDYVAPEQIRDAHAADARSDVYSLGCTLYFLLTGWPPFLGGGSAQKMAAHLEKQPAALKGLRPELPAELVQVVERMMAKEPALRYQTPGDVVIALGPWCQAGAATSEPPGQRPAARGRSRGRRGVAVAGGVALVPVVAAIAYFAFGPGNAREREPIDKSSLSEGADLKPAGPGKRQPRTGKEPAPPPEAAGLKEGDPAPDLSKVKKHTHDDFRAPARSVFPRERSDQHELFFKKGLYVLRLFSTVTPENFRTLQDYYRWQGDPSTGDVACQVEGRALTGGDHGWSVGFVTPGRDRSVAVRVRRDGAVEVGPIRQSVTQPTVTTVGPIRHRKIRPGDEFNTVRVILRGGRMLELYVNGWAICAPIHLEQPLSPVSAAIQVWARCGHYDVESRAELKRFTVWRLSP
jgi:hypothetical protein